MTTEYWQIPADQDFPAASIKEDSDFAHSTVKQIGYDLLSAAFRQYMADSGIDVDEFVTRPGQGHWIVKKQKMNEHFDPSDLKSSRWVQEKTNLLKCFLDGLQWHFDGFYCVELPHGSYPKIETLLQLERDLGAAPGTLVDKRLFTIEAQTALKLLDKKGNPSKRAKRLPRLKAAEMRQELKAKVNAARVKEDALRRKKEATAKERQFNKKFKALREKFQPLLNALQ
ncbi:MAG: hypothetical protein SWH78_04310 [Thermodesulfobacteriota bacterium]|nr:hypothetical protein [Thermodesulfobacteriota bacterium]